MVGKRSEVYNLVIKYVIYFWSLLQRYVPFVGVFGNDTRSAIWSDWPIQF